jgi:outer membrane protein OmpA-like peptidoglycan-associated protein
MKRFAHPGRRRGNDPIWQVTYMDMMTIVMVFFVILWSLSQKEERGISNKTGDETVKMVSLPGDVLFPTGKAELTDDGREVLKKLFDDPSGTVLSFETSGLSQRLLVVHGHTDGDGEKDENLDLGYQRAMSAYREITRYGGDLQHHVVICTHADNSPSQEVPAFEGVMTPAETALVREAKAKNRRITIEDKMVSRFRDEGR